MATVRKREDSYQICVSSGTGANGKQVRHYRTWTPDPGMTQKQIEKAVIAAACNFEREIEQGYIADDRQKFEEYAEYVLTIKEREGVRPSTLARYRELLARINPEIGHLKLAEIRPAHLNNFYSQLLKPGGRTSSGMATPRVDLRAELKRRKITQAKAAELAGLSVRSVEEACRHSVRATTAEKLAAALNVKTEKLFTIERDKRPLSAKTALEYHRLISTILSQAEKELIVPYNAAAKATPPRPKKHDPDYFQPETVHAILDAAKSEPLKYQVFVNLLAVTGCRRGELAGLKWEKIDFETGKIRIDSALCYTGALGTYTTDTKTGEHRTVIIPKETISLLKELRREQLQTRFINHDRWVETGYVFTQDNGEPMNPQTCSGWLCKFSKRHNLPHIHPHSFRHTAASVLIANGVDIVTVSKMLGHASVTTTENFYSHLIEDAKTHAAETIADVLIRKRA